MELILKLVVLLILISIGYFRGRYHEKQHLSYLKKAEEELSDIVVFASRYPNLQLNKQVVDPVLVSGNSVVSADYFKYFLASIRKWFGGNYVAYEQLTSRARRHAIIRMKQQAKDQGCKVIYHVRYETVQISDVRQGQLPEVEVFCYGTGFLHTTETVANSSANYQLVAIPIHQYEEPFSTFKNPYGLGLLVFGVLSVVLSWILMMVLNPLPLRYVNSAPWLLFWLVAIGCYILLYRFTHQKKLPRFDRVILTAFWIPFFLTIPYFAFLKVNVMGLPLQQHTYQTSGTDTLKPALEANHLPTIRLDHQSEYWKNQPVGVNVSLSLVHGRLGYWYYSDKDNYPAYDSFYRANR